MSLGLSDPDRRILPRWRNFSTTALLGELDGAGQSTPEFQGPEFFEQKVLEWQAQHDIATAADLVSASLVIGKQAIATDAAEFLLSSNSDATDTVKRVAQIVLGTEPIEPDVLSFSSASAIHMIKGRLREQPRNPIAWTELARMYAMGGQSEKARSAMRSAVALVEGNRYVLRAATRLFVHLDDPQEAHHLLRSRAAVRDDPWLLAAEIAVASITGQSSDMIKRGRTLLARGEFAPRQLAELTSAIATREMEHGNAIAAKRLFRQSLEDPTDNSVAQASWAARRRVGVAIDSRLLHLSHTFEARTWDRYEKRRWIDAVKEAEQWMFDEPFSSRPALMGSYLASSTLRDFQKSERFASYGLAANPKDPGLMNNLVNALANQDRLDEAEKLYKRIKGTGAPLHTQLTLMATEGLLHFRRGRLEHGRNAYKSVIELAQREQLPALATRALAHLAWEEFLGATGGGQRVLAELKDIENFSQKYPDLMPLLTELETIVAGKNKVAG
jgi:tetratricopeptide (TPR) repeat protein